MADFYTDNDVPNPPRPSIPPRFAVAVERIGREADIDLRLTWAPDVVKPLWGALHKAYCYKRDSKHLGWWEGHMEDVNGRQLFTADRYRKKSAYDYEPNATHRLGENKWLHPDLLPQEWAWPRWIIERKLLDSERVNHERERYEWVDGVRVDALGPWPEGGKWGCLTVIAHHFHLCCEIAEREYLEGKRPTGLCFGQGRPPCEQDLDDLRQSIVDGERTGLSEPTFETALDYDTRETINQLIESEYRQNQHYGAVIQNVLTPALRMPNLRPFLDAIEKAANT